jgi:hypothetical protein
LSKRKVACFVVAGAAAVTLAAYSATAQRDLHARIAEQASGDIASPQTTNRASKTNRLIQTALQTIEHKPVYALASAMPDLSPQRAPDPVLATPQLPDPAAAAPQIFDPVLAMAPTTDPEPADKAEPRPAEGADPKAAKTTPTLREKLTEKAKRLLPQPPAHNSGLLDDGQIAALKTRLRLSPDQIEYWPAVEAALRDVVRTQLRGQRAHGGKINIDTNSAEVQKLIWAAMPLLMRLREDQKNEVRKLARVIGLEQVASQI